MYTLITKYLGKVLQKANSLTKASVSIYILTDALIRGPLQWHSYSLAI